MCLHYDVNVSGSELSMRHHSENKNLFHLGVIISEDLMSLCTGRLKEGIYGLPADFQHLTRDGESDVEGSSEYPASLYVTNTFTALHFTFLDAQFCLLALLKKTL